MITERYESMIKLTEVKVPDIGDFDKVEIIDIAVNPGDTIKIEDTLITLESDKATMDIPSSHAGTVKKINASVGDKVGIGDLILMLEESASQSNVAQLKSEPEQARSNISTTPERDKSPELESYVPRPAPTGLTGSITVGSSLSAKAHASPVIRKFARELGVDLGLVRGSGRKGRILRKDVMSFTKAVMSGEQLFGRSHGTFSFPEAPLVDFSKFGAVKFVPLTRLNKLSGQNLHRSWINVPHVTQFDEADITELEQYRLSKKEEMENHGTKLTILSFLIKAAVVALKQFPKFNSSLSADGEQLIMKQYFHIGVAVNTEQGLMVPVIKDVDKKDMYDLAKELAILAQKARDKKLTPSEMQGGCFTISSLGHIGGSAFTPIINTPQVSIMGVARSAIKPVYINGKFEPRLILPFSISYDHRVIDGVAAAEFTRAVSRVLMDIRDTLM